MKKHLSRPACLPSCLSTAGWGRSPSCALPCLSPIAAREMWATAMVEKHRSAPSSQSRHCGRKLLCCLYFHHLLSPKPQGGTPGRVLILDPCAWTYRGLARNIHATEKATQMTGQSDQDDSQNFERQTVVRQGLCSPSSPEMHPPHGPDHRRRNTRQNQVQQ
jgi:hypothetical protein